MNRVAVVLLDAENHLYWVSCPECECTRRSNMLPLVFPDISGAQEWLSHHHIQNIYEPYGKGGCPHHHEEDIELGQWSLPGLICSMCDGEIEEWMGLGEFCFACEENSAQVHLFLEAVS